VGSGFRTFTAGEVLTASNVQNYLMDQSVMVFGGSAARSSAIGTANFEEGMVSYLTDTDKVEAYNGTDWVSVAPTTSQGLTLINTTSFSGVATQTINNVFTTSYRHYRIILQLTAGTSDADLQLRMRIGATTTATNYYYGGNLVIFDGSNSIVNGNNTTQWPLGSIDTSNQNIAQSYSMDIFSPQIARSTNLVLKGWSQQTGGNTYMLNFAGVQNDATQFDGFAILATAGNISGKVSVYGYNE